MSKIKIRYSIEMTAEIDWVEDELHLIESDADLLCNAPLDESYEVYGTKELLSATKDGKEFSPAG